MTHPQLLQEICSNVSLLFNSFCGCLGNHNGPEPTVFQRKDFHVWFQQGITAGKIWLIPLTQWQHIHGYNFRYIIVLTLPCWCEYVWSRCWMDVCWQTKGCLDSDASPSWVYVAEGLLKLIWFMITLLGAYVGWIWNFLHIHVCSYTLFIFIKRMVYKENL